MKDLDLFLPYVLPYAPGCTDTMAKQAVLSACIEFCARTLTVQHTGTDTVSEGVSDYDVEEPPSLALVRILAVYFLDQKLTPRSREMVVRGAAARGGSIPTVAVTLGTPTEWFNRDPALPQVSIYPTPADTFADALTIVAGYQPTRTATKVPDTLFDDFAEDIAAGAIARLLVMPGYQFSAPAAAKPFITQFSSAMSTAAALARTGLGTGASRVRFRAFA